jgi:hypothetical protein
VSAIAIAGNVEALAQALRDREHEDQRYTFAGRVKFDDVLEGTLLTRGVVPVRGFEPRSRG